MTGYEEDLAFIHDTGFGDFATEAAPELLRILKRHGIAKGLVVDLGCGSGIWARKLVDAGYSVFGVDIAPAMIKLAKKKAPQGKFITGSLLDARLPPCDAVTCISECINYTFDRRNSRKELTRCFQRIYGALRPGGLFAFDFAEPGQLRPGQTRKAFWEGEDWAVLLEAREDSRRHLLIREITSFRRRGRLFRRSDETHILRLFRAADLKADLTRIGFDVKIQHGYGRIHVPPTHSAVIARKP